MTTQAETIAKKNQERKVERVLAGRRRILEDGQRRREEEGRAGAAPAPAPAPAPTTPKEPVCFKRSDFVLKESICNVWAANAGPEITVDALARSETYLPRIQDLKAGDVIWVTNYQRRWVGEVYVADSIAGRCAPIVLRVIELPPPLEDTEQQLPSAYFIKRTEEGYCPMRRARPGLDVQDSPMRPAGENFRRFEEARSWLMTYIATVNKGGPRG